MMKEFSPQTVVSKRGGYNKTSWISISNKGRISFNTLMCEKMDLKENDGIKFFQDEKENGKWLIEKSKDGFSLRKTDASNSLVFQCSELSRTIIESVGAKGTSIKVNIYPEPEKIDKRKLYMINFTLVDM